MLKFTNIRKVETIYSASKTVCAVIYKVRKEGTKREFYAIENEEGKRVCSIMFSRKWEAVKTAKAFINHEIEKMAKEIEETSQVQPEEKPLTQQLKEAERKEKRYSFLEENSTNIDERIEYRKLKNKYSDLADKLFEKIEQQNQEQPEKTPVEDQPTNQPKKYAVSLDSFIEARNALYECIILKRDSLTSNKEKLSHSFRSQTEKDIIKTIVDQEQKQLKKLEKSYEEYLQIHSN